MTGRKRPKEHNYESARDTLGRNLVWAVFRDNTEFLAQAPPSWTEMGTRQQAAACSSRLEKEKVIS